MWQFYIIFFWLTMNILNHDEVEWEVESRLDWHTNLTKNSKILTNNAANTKYLRMSQQHCKVNKSTYALGWPKIYHWWIFFGDIAENWLFLRKMTVGKVLARYLNVYPSHNGLFCLFIYFWCKIHLNRTGGLEELREFTSRRNKNRQICRNFHRNVCGMSQNSPKTIFFGIKKNDLLMIVDIDF